jgi:hypothetical protein
MSDEIKTCVSCMHFEGPRDYYQHQMQIQIKGRDEPQCKNPKAASLDPIYGIAFCRNERANTKGCGKQGKLWESRQTGNAG